MSRTPRGSEECKLLAGTLNYRALIQHKPCGTGPYGFQHIMMVWMVIIMIIIMMENLLLRIETISINYYCQLGIRQQKLHFYCSSSLSSNFFPSKSLTAPTRGFTSHTFITLLYPVYNSRRIDKPTRSEACHESIMHSGS